MNYFKEPAAHYRYQIGDDHQPFLEKGMVVILDPDLKPTVSTVYLPASVAFYQRE